MEPSSALTNRPKKTQILLVDDQLVVRRGVAAIVGARSDWEIQGEAATGREAIAAIAERSPDIVIMGVEMKDMSGVEIIHQIRTIAPATEILVLSMIEAEQTVIEVLAAGARGYIMKRGNDLLEAVDAVLQHRVYFDSKVSEILLCAFLTTRNSPRDLADPIRSLSNREREILQLVAEGKSNKDVALAMNISLKTVETHRTNLMAKLGLHSIGELVRYAFRNNIIGD